MPVSSKPSRAALFTAFALVYVIWGSTYLGIRFAIESLPPLLMAGTRYALAGGLLYGVMRLRGAPRPPLRSWGRALLIGICLLTFGNGGVTLGEQYIPSGLAALLVATVPMLLALLGWASGVSGRPTPLAALGLGLGLAGVYLLARAAGGSHAVALPGHEALGIGCVLTAAVVWAIGSLYGKRHRAAASPFVAGGMQMLCGGLVMVVLGLARGEAQQLHLAAVSAKSWWAYAYLVTFGSLVAFTAYVWLLQAVAPALAGTYAFVNPVVAVGLGWAFGGEQLSWPMLGGGALVVVAVGLLLLGSRAPEAAKKG
ncbi:EamA family transporter [Hymenobacter caeli]|uniref:Drug/metabolite transporter (DMT)-like permease n=1 Tax=Hymenobacter caeli TaxID=2735894 RepID=A0ABX2FPM7_9BACT|nr:EamA family transporter [Hymenobacter caeli]NRT18429.1 drug/metabolite transporter (DMT)-like permease [Hymenobacter caeli]